jgi:predicted  nucleic acid-binding Zn-ribbon protein
MPTSGQTPDPQINQTLLGVIATAVSIIVALVAVLYKNLTGTDKDQQDQLDDGADEFFDLKLSLANAKQDIDSIRTWVKAVEKELDDLEDKRLKDHEAFIIMKDQHFRNHGEKVE